MSDDPVRRWRMPPNLDFDRLLQVVQKEVELAAKRWQDGRPHDEAAFLNHLTGIMGRHRRGCDVGVSERMQAHSHLYYLHREETDSSDKYGADLAITLRIGTSWTKTAIFQLKKAKEYKFSLNKDDLKAAHEDQRIADRSFLMAIDENRLGVRFKKISDLKEDFDRTRHGSMTCKASDWTNLSSWLKLWLQCQLSPPTRIDDPAPVEGLLEAFRHDVPDPDPEFDFQPAQVNHLKSIPAKDWLKIELK